MFLVFKECAIVIYEGLQKFCQTRFLSLFKKSSLRLTRQRLYGSAVEKLFFLDEERERDRY